MKPPFLRTKPQPFFDFFSHLPFFSLEIELSRHLHLFPLASGSSLIGRTSGQNYPPYELTLTVKLTPRPYLDHKPQPPPPPHQPEQKKFRSPEIFTSSSTASLGTFWQVHFSIQSIQVMIKSHGYLPPFNNKWFSRSPASEIGPLWLSFTPYERQPMEN